MKKYFFLLIALLLFPIIAFAEVTEIGESDFVASKSNPNTKTGKITYVPGTYSGCYYFEDGEYKFTEDYDFAGDQICLKDVTVTLDLGNHTISTDNVDPWGTYLVRANNADVTLAGNGTYNERIYIVDGSLTIENGTFNYGVFVEGDSTNNILIENGTYKNGIFIEGESTNTVHIKNASTPVLRIRNAPNSTITIDNGKFVASVFDSIGALTINDGEFINKDDEINISVSDANSVIINDGTFECVGLYGNMIIGNHVEINGGEFKSDQGALAIANNNLFGGENSTIILRGGHFIATGDNAVAAIIYATTGENDMASWVAEGYQYNEELVFKDVSGFYGIQNEIRVNPIAVDPTDDEDEETTKEEEKEIPDDKKDETTPSEGKSSEDKSNPKTGDNIMTYTLLTIISGVGLIGLRKCKRN